MIRKYCKPLLASLKMSYKDEFSLKNSVTSKENQTNTLYLVYWPQVKMSQCISVGTWLGEEYSHTQVSYLRYDKSMIKTNVERSYQS